MIDPVGERPVGLASGVRWTVPDLVVGTALALVSSTLFGALMFIPMDGPLGPLDPLVFPVVVAVSGGALLWVVWWMTVHRYSVPWSSLGLRWPARKQIYWTGPAVLIGSLAFTGVYTAIVTELGHDILIPERLPENLFGRGVFGVIAAMLVIVWVPFVEEVFFRGFLFAGLAARYGVLVGAISSSILFALAHVSLGAMLPIFVTGMLFAWAYQRTRSTWIPVSAHAAQNLLAVLTIGLV